VIDQTVEDSFKSPPTYKIQELDTLPLYTRVSLVGTVLDVSITNNHI